MIYVMPLTKSFLTQIVSKHCCIQIYFIKNVYIEVKFQFQLSNENIHYLRKFRILNNENLEFSTEF